MLLIEMQIDNTAPRIVYRNAFANVKPMCSPEFKSKRQNGCNVEFAIINDSRIIPSSMMPNWLTGQNHVDLKNSLVVFKRRVGKTAERKQDVDGQEPCVRSNQLDLDAHEKDGILLNSC